MRVDAAAAALAIAIFAVTPLDLETQFLLAGATGQID